MNRLSIDDPLDTLRTLFRDFWSLRQQAKWEEANTLWEIEVPVEIENLRQSHPDVSENRIQTLLFEEKRRYEDLQYLADKISNHLDRNLTKTTETQRAESPARSEKHNTQQRHKQVAPQMHDQRVSSTHHHPQKTNTPGLDLAAMIDSMLEEDKALNR